MRVARDDDAVIGEKDQRERAFKLKQSVAQGAGQSALARMRDQVQDDFGIAGGLEDRPFALQILAQLGRVGDVAVVRDREASFITSDREGLGVEQHGIAGSGVAGVADGKISPGRPPRTSGVKRSATWPMPHGKCKIAAVTGGDARAFLAAMLKRV